jgi:predicted metalloprotease
MRWTPGGRSEDLDDERSSGGSFIGGGGLGLGGFLILGVLSLVFGRDFITPFFRTQGGNSAVSAPNPAQDQAEEPKVQFVSFVLDDTQKTWEKIFAAQGKTYTHARLVLFRNGIQSACGSADSAVGPFYCPGDQKVYMDLGFYDELKRRFGATGDFAQAYVLAHEIGHHVQDLLGLERQVRHAQQLNPGERNPLSVKVELQADCYAGVWGHSTNERKILESGDLEEALRAAAAIGDDNIQKMSRGYVVPESFTHGSSAQRSMWFRRGFDSGDPASCNTFAQ